MSLVTTGVCRYIVDLNVVQCSNFSNEASKVCATGVPAAVRDRRVIVELVERVDRLEQRNTELHAATRAQLDGQPAAVAAHIVDNFTVSGCAPITAAMLQEQFEGLRREMELARQHPGASAASATASATTAPSHEGSTIVPGTWYSNFAHSGMFNLSVPADFKLATGDDVSKAWMLWHFGDRVNRIRPYRLFKSRVDITKRNHRAYSSLKSVMAELPQPDATQDHVVSPEALATFSAAFPAVAAKAYAGKPPANVENIAFITLYERLRKRAAAEMEADEDEE